jgi:uncharacterized protein YbjT (DUF2867 family)
MRCLARQPEELRAKVDPRIEVVAGDVLDLQSLENALTGIEQAYYLVHLLGGSRDFEREDRTAAENFATAARNAGVRRIIYLGGLGDESDQQLSPHLRSRHEVGQILRESGVEVIEFRASIIIGNGSLSFNLVKSLTERLPVMICPRWLATPTQPIAIDDMVEYLRAARELPFRQTQVFEVGGADVVTYGDLIREYARQRGLTRVMIPVPVLTPYLSGLWLALVTPTQFTTARHLIEGLKNSTIVRDNQARIAFELKPVGVREAIERTLGGDRRNK